MAQNTTSAGTATLLLTENAKDALKTTGTMTVTIVPAPPGVGTVEWAGTPVLSAPDSLGASVSIAGNQLIITIKGHDDLNVETISISGLKIKASKDASPGNVVATLSDNAAGAIYTKFVPLTTTATGTLQSFVGTAVTVNTTSGCGFGVSGNTATFGGQKDVSINAVSGTVPGVQNITLSAPLTGTHAIGEAVTQTVPNCTSASIGSPAKVVTAAKFTYSGTPTVFPGESNSRAGDLQVIEPAAGFLAKGTTLTFTIATAGVVFSKVPVAVDAGGGIAYSAPVLSADRKTVTLSITTASTKATQVWLGNTAEPFFGNSPVLYDVAATVPGGTYVDVNLTLSGDLLVTGNPAQNAIVFRGIDASAPTPIVYIGENNQATGLVTLTEKSAGIFNSGTGSNNVIAVCTLGVNYSYTFAPWAKVTVGDLRLREGSVASPDNIVAGSLDSITGCYTWTVWTASTTASTIVIGNDTFSTGPLINVKVNQAPGIVAMDIYSGNSANYDDQLIASVGFAVASFKNQVAVTALSQPTIPAGAVTKAGAIQIMETANGQLKNNERICFEIMPRGSAANIQAKYDTLISSLNTAQLPIVTASGGLVVGQVSVSNESCAGANIVPSNQVISFSFKVLQQSTDATGKLVVDNINLITLADASSGTVLFNVFGYGGAPTKVEFQSQVSNAKIGVKAAIAISSTSALGLMPNQGAWTTATKVQKLKGYVTWRFVGSPALAGKLVQIQVAAKNSSGGWGAFGTLTSAKVDASGTAYFQWRQKTPAWLSVRAYYPGDISLAESCSPARQARWR